MKWCAICLREERGFGFCPRMTGYRGLPDAKFCSMRCLDLYAALFRKGGGVVDLTDLERAAIRSCLKPLGECVAEIGVNKPLSAYSKEQVLTLIEVVVTAYQDALRKPSPEPPF